MLAPLFPMREPQQMFGTISLKVNEYDESDALFCRLVSYKQFSIRIKKQRREEINSNIKLKGIKTRNFWTVVQ